MRSTHAAAVDALAPSRTQEQAEGAVSAPRVVEPWLEFLLVGGATPLLFPVAWLLRAVFGLDDAELGVGFVMFYAAHLINDPHFAVTYVLFYKHVRARALGNGVPRAQRLRYVLAGLVAPVLLLGWAIYALVVRSAASLGAMVQLMFFLVGFHYVKQGFGILTVLGARRGVNFTRGERAALIFHAYAGWAYAWASPYDPGRRLEEKGLLYQTFAHPRWLEGAAKLVLLGSLVLMLYLLVQKYRREGRFPLLTPLTGFLCSIWAWSIYSSIDPLVRYVVPALHSVQYLYMVWLLKSNEAHEREGAPWFEPSVATRIAMLALTAVVLGFILFHAAPTLLDDSFLRTKQHRVFGPTPYFVALYVFVNIHHYLMDMVIWRRDNPLTRYLRQS